MAQTRYDLPWKDEFKWNVVLGDLKIRGSKLWRNFLKFNARITYKQEDFVEELNLQM
jgi:hypothetical protein